MVGNAAKGMTRQKIKLRRGVSLNSFVLLHHTISIFFLFFGVIADMPCSKCPLLMLERPGNPLHEMPVPRAPGPPLEGYNRHCAFLSVQG